MISKAFEVPTGMLLWVSESGPWPNTVHVDLMNKFLVEVIAAYATVGQLLHFLR